MAVLLYDKFTTFFDSLGNPRALGKLKSYETGTTTPKATYSDGDLTTENDLIMTLDAAGRLEEAVYGGSGDYKFILTNADGTDSITMDPVSGFSPGSETTAATLAAAKAKFGANIELDDGTIVHLAGRTGVNDGYGGEFAYKASDTTTTFEQDALGFVDDEGRRFHRLFSGPWQARWFNLALDGSNETSALNTLLTLLDGSYETIRFESPDNIIGVTKFDLTGMNDFCLDFADKFAIKGIDAAGTFLFGCDGTSGSVYMQRMTIKGFPRLIGFTGSSYADLARFVYMTDCAIQFVPHSAVALTNAYVNINQCWLNTFFIPYCGSSFPTTTSYGWYCGTGSVNGNKIFADRWASPTSAAGSGLVMRGNNNEFHFGDCDGWAHPVTLGRIEGCSLWIYNEASTAGWNTVDNTTSGPGKISGFVTGTISTPLIDLTLSAGKFYGLDMSGLYIRDCTNGMKATGSQLVNFRSPSFANISSTPISWTDGSRPVDQQFFPLTLPNYTVATLPSATTLAAMVVYVSNESGGAVVAFSDGTNWRRVTDRAIVS